MKDVVGVLDLERRCFTYVSPSVTQLRGHTPEEVMAQPLEAALTPESQVQVAAAQRNRCRPPAPAFVDGATH